MFKGTVSAKKHLNPDENNIYRCNYKPFYINKP